MHPPYPRGTISTVLKAYLDIRKPLEIRSKLIRLQLAESKRDLESAMRQLFRDGRIVNEVRPGSRPARPSYRIMPVKA